MTATSEDATDGRTVRTAGPPLPEVAFEVINPLVSLVLRSPLHGLLSDSLLLLTFTGRKSGNGYTTPVGYEQREDTLIVTTHSPWWKNLRGGQPVSVLLRGERRQGIAEPTTDTEAVAAYVREFIERRGLRDARRLGIEIDGEGVPTYEELKAGLDDLVVVHITLEDAGA